MWQLLACQGGVCKKVQGIKLHTNTDFEDVLRASTPGDQLVFEVYDGSMNQLNTTGTREVKVGPNGIP